MNNRRPMVVMLLDNHYPPDRRVQFEISLLMDGGMDVRLVCWDRRVAIQSRTTPSPGHDLVRVRSAAPHGLGWKALVPLVRFSRSVLRHRRRLISDADCIVVHDLYLLPLGVLLCAITGSRLVYDAHEDWAAMEQERYPSALRRVIAGLESLLARSASSVVVPGQSRVERWRRSGIEPMVLRNLGAGSERVSLGEVAGRCPQYDISYCGSLIPARRIDLLLELAERLPAIRVAIAGAGRLESDVSAAARRLSNVDFLGWITNPEDLLSRSRTVYYGLDPARAYSTHACPNTLYMAIRVGRPLVFFCEGEPDAINQRFAIGVRGTPTVDGLEMAMRSATARNRGSWQFDEAWNSLNASEMQRRYVETIADTLDA